MGDPIIVVPMSEEEREGLRSISTAVNLLKRHTELLPQEYKPPTPPGEPWLTVDEVRTLCRCQIGRVRRAIASGALPATDESQGKGGKKIKYVEREIAMRWMRSGRPESP